MELNQEYIKGMLEIKRNELLFNNLRLLPKIAQKFIDMGNERGIKIEIVYGIKSEKEGVIAGYWIKAPEEAKAIFLQDIYIDDESDENINASIKWMSLSFDELEIINKK